VSEDIPTASDDGEVVEAEIVATPPDSPEALGLVLPEDAAEAVPLLLQELAEARTSGESYLDDLQRVVADFDNYRKRVQREQSEGSGRASAKLVTSLLPVLDSFDVAFIHEAETSGEEKLLSGMRSTYQLLMDTLSKEGLEPVAALGERFDPELHEAVQAPDNPDGGDLLVTQELRRGYLLGGRILRPALVAVDHA
jgi:molecular chaperone GrpE